MKIFYVLGLLIIIGFLSVFFFYNQLNKYSGLKNGFNRTTNSLKITQEGLMDLDRENYRIFSLNSTHISLFKYNKPYEIKTVEIDLKNQSDFRLPVKLDKKKYNGINSITAIDSTIYLLDGYSSTIEEFEPTDESIITRLDSLPFYQSQVINPNSFLFISIQGHKEKRRILKKVNWLEKMTYTYTPDKQSEGIFSSDGTFSYDRISNSLIYMYYYKGQLDCLDSNLKIILKIKTIDTIKHAALDLSPIGKSRTRSTPPSIVNRRFCIANNKIYVHSYIKADNEEIDQFKKSQVIDIYDLKNGKYDSSIYLPRINTRKLSDLRIHKDRIAAIYSDKLVIFKIHDGH